MQRFSASVLVLFVVASSFSLTAFAQTSSPNELLTVDQAIAASIANSRALKISALETEKLQDRIAAIVTKRRPTAHVDLLGAQTLAPIRFTFEPGQFGTFPST